MTRKTVLSLSLLLAVSAGLAAAAQSEILAKLRASESDANDRIFGAVSGAYFSPAGDPGVFKAATPEGRAIMVKAVMALARAYTGSADFAARYKETRENEKPSPPEPTPTGAQLREQQRKGMEEAIANATRTAKDMPAMKKDLDAMVVEFRKQMAEIGKDPAMNALVDEGQKAQAAAAAEKYKEDLLAWEKSWPLDPKRLVASRLREFLELAASVDFAAKTQVDGSDKKSHFVNDAYESKDSRWKLLFRAGKPAVDAARDAAQEWLKALGV